jgi:hypothetical protein
MASPRQSAARWSSGARRGSARALLEHAEQRVVAITPHDDHGPMTARQLRGLARARAVVLTPSADASVFDGALDGFAFLAKADICREAVLEIVRSDESGT